MYDRVIVYDIKGSKINRHAKPKKKKGKVSVFKDNDMKKTLRMGISPHDSHAFLFVFDDDANDDDRSCASNRVVQSIRA